MRRLTPKKSAAHRAALRSAAAVFLLAACLLSSCKAGQGQEKPARKDAAQPYAAGALTASPEGLGDKLALLKEKVVAEDESEIIARLKVTPDGGRFTVFISVCDTVKKASVFSGCGESLGKAFDAAADKAEKAVEASALSPVWVKADLVCRSESVSLKSLCAALALRSPYCYRRGVSLDSGFQKAFLEAELNAGGIYDYSSDSLSLAAVNRCLSAAGKDTVDALPESLTVFSCRGWICDGDSGVYLLSENDQYGVRVVENADAGYISGITAASGAYLLSCMNEDGSFAYGFYASDSSSLDGYNSIRHAGVLWSLACCAEGASDADADKLKSAVKRGIDYMIGKYVVYKDDGTAFYTQDNKAEIQLGGNALALLAISQYISLTGDNAYLEVARALAAGIVYLHENAGEGAYIHTVAYPSYAVSAEFASVYYDGEATLALARFYSVDKNEAWINTAAAALDVFCEKNYGKYADHWIAYSCNEVTKYKPVAGYYELGFITAYTKMEEIAGYDSVSPTSMEMLTSVFEMYCRMKKADTAVSVTYPEGFSPERLASVIELRAGVMLSGFGYPELVMYFDNPARCLGCVFIRSENFRVRIDDVQHTLGAYLNYIRVYEDIAGLLYR